MGEVGDLSELDLLVFEWLKRYVVAMGYPPSTAEIQREFGLSSKYLAQLCLFRLDAYGFLDVDAGVTRGIRIHHLPAADDLAGARLKLWLSEAAGLLRQHCPEAAGVPEALRRFAVVAF